MLNVILADDDTLVREGIKMILIANESVNVLGEASNGTQVVGMVDEGATPDIVLTDINMPEMDGILLVETLKKINPGIKIIMLTMSDSNKFIQQAFTAGASGYLLKTIHPDELIFALNQVNQGDRYICSTLAMRLLDRSIEFANIQSSPNDLNIEFSNREMEILGLIAEGLTNQEMSERLFLSKRTIEGHRQSLIEKTGCRNTATLIKYAVLNGMIQ
ncbi:response regulator transcription factor [Pedobacter immunditicola]|uniref:response regulator transcription factor n=1 Tax=Pedobacter immunditicola TaxID=3133440 RepID=UPI00309F129B